jgi:hypothetical protein
MAQNRDHRYATAAEMRKALQSVGPRTTLLSRGEADTVLFPPSGPAALPPTQANIQRLTVQTGETTMVRESGRFRKTPWAIAGGIVLLLVATVGGFYALQRKNNPASVSEPAPAQPSPTPIQNAIVEDSPASPDTSDESKKVEADKELVASEERAVKKQENAAKEKEATKNPADRASTVHDRSGEGHAQQNLPPDPKVPEVVVPEVPRIGQPRVNTRPNGVIVRDFPDGTRLIINPDGTRVMVRPDGTRRVFRPGERINRRIFRRP